MRSDQRQPGHGRRPPGANAHPETHSEADAQAHAQADAQAHPPADSEAYAQTDTETDPDEDREPDGDACARRYSATDPGRRQRDPDGGTAECRADAHVVAIAPPRHWWLDWGRIRPGRFRGRPDFPTG